MTFKGRDHEQIAKTARKIALLLDAGSKTCTKNAESALEDVEEYFASLCADYLTDSKMRAKLQRLAGAIRGVVAPWNDLLSGGVFPFAVPKVIESMDDFFKFGRLCGEVAAAAEKEKRTKPNIDAAMKVEAVEHAYRLVKQYGLKPSYKNKETEYCRVAKLLHGGGADLTKQCKTYAEEQSDVRARRQAKKAKT